MALVYCVLLTSYERYRQVNSFCPAIQSDIRLYLDISHRIHVCHINGSTFTINIPQMLASIYHTWIRHGIWNKRGGSPHESEVRWFNSAMFLLSLLNEPGWTKPLTKWHQPPSNSVKNGVTQNDELVETLWKPYGNHELVSFGQRPQREFRLNCIGSSMAMDINMTQRLIGELKFWLVVNGCHEFYFPIHIGLISSSQLTNSNLFQRGG